MFDDDGNLIIVDESEDIQDEADLEEQNEERDEQPGTQDDPTKEEPAKEGEQSEELTKKTVDATGLSEEDIEAFRALFPDVELVNVGTASEEEQPEPQETPAEEKKPEEKVAPAPENYEQPEVKPSSLLDGKSIGDIVFGEWELDKDEDGPYISDGVHSFRIDAQGLPVVDKAWAKELFDEDPTRYTAMRAAYTQCVRDHKEATAEAAASAQAQDRLVTETATKVDAAVKELSPKLTAEYEKRYEGAPQAKAIADAIVTLYPEIIAEKIAQVAPAVAKKQGISLERASLLVKASMTQQDHINILGEAENRVQQLAITGKLKDPAAKPNPNRGKIVPPTEGGGSARVVSRPAGGNGKNAMVIPAAEVQKMRNMGFDDDTIKAAFKNAKEGK